MRYKLIMLLLVCNCIVWTNAYSKDEKIHLSNILTQVNQLEKKSSSEAKSALKRMQPQVQALNEQFDGYIFDTYVKALIHSIVTSLREKKYKVAKQKNEVLQQLVSYFREDLKSWETAQLVHAATGNFFVWLYTDENKYKKQAEKILEEATVLDIEKSQFFARILKDADGNLSTEDKKSVLQAKSISGMRHIDLYVMGLMLKQEQGVSQVDLQRLAMEGREKYSIYTKRLQLKSLDEQYKRLLVTAKKFLDSSHFKLLQMDYQKLIELDK